MASAPTTVTVKKADGSTDIVYTTIASAGQDGAPWLLRCESAAGTTIGQRSMFAVSSSANGSGGIRNVKITGKYPETYTDSSTGLVQVRGYADFSATFHSPNTMSDLALAEFAAQFANLIATPAVKGAISSGYAPT